MSKTDNEITIDVLNANQRLDKFLLKQMNLSSKSFIYKMLRKKRIKLNGKKAEGNEILCCGDIISYYLSPETIENQKEEKQPNRNAGALSIVFEDDNIIIVDKPQGVLTHKESAKDFDTMVDRAYLHVCKNDEKPPFVPVCANRLDRNTSGIVVFAKNLPSAQWLAKAFRDREVEKTYITVVHGEINTEINISLALIKDSEQNKSIVSEFGKESITKVVPIEFCRDYSVLSVLLITGRTHQIRAHLSHIGHPVIGDIKYLNTISKQLEHKYDIHYQLLHCHKIMFKEQMGFLSYLSNKEFVCKLPFIFSQFTKSAPIGRS